MLPFNTDTNATTHTNNFHSTIQFKRQQINQSINQSINTFNNLLLIQPVPSHTCNCFSAEVADRSHSSVQLTARHIKHWDCQV